MTLQIEPEEEEDTLYDVALRVTDDVLGAGTYARVNADHPDPGVRAAIARWRGRQYGVRMMAERPLTPGDEDVIAELLGRDRG